MRRLVSLSLLLLPAALAAQNRSPSQQGSAVRVGPEHGTVIVVGGGSMGPEIYSAFIKAAGGPDALIIDVPTAGGDTAYTQDAPGTRGWKQAGARNVYVLHTNDKKLADSDSFAAILKKAGGVWFEGGRQFHLVDSYAGTKTEAGFNDVLARGGVIGGSSAGASILGDFLVRGAPSNDNFIMDYPGYEKGFAYIRGVGIDQHVVARERLADLADSIIPKYPNLLGMSEDEGTAWVVRGDTATIIGRDKAFVYGGKDPTDTGKPFLTLYPGDRYNLATRKVMHRAAERVETVDRIPRLAVQSVRRADGRRRHGARRAGRQGARRPVVRYRRSGEVHADDHGPAVPARRYRARIHRALRAIARGLRRARWPWRPWGSGKSDASDATTKLFHAPIRDAGRTAQDDNESRGSGPV